MNMIATNYIADVIVELSKKGTTCGVWTPNRFANSYPRRSDCVAILDDDIFMTAAASFGEASSLP